MSIIRFFGMATLAAVVSSAACGTQDDKPATQSGMGEVTYEVSLTLSSVADLPTCDRGRAGQVAFVENPPSLYTCVSNTWRSLSCTQTNAGAVAYSSVDGLLVACIARAWTVVAIPPGPKGDPGPSSLVKTSDEPAGDNCPGGGVRIDSGVDADGNGMLDEGEVSGTEYVCHGSVVPDGGECVPASLRCDGPQQEICDSTGTWKDVGPACAFACIDGACAECAPGSTQCSDPMGVGGGVQSCDESGHWGAPEACVGQSCVYGACEGVCEQGQTMCQDNGVAVCWYGQWYTSQWCYGQACVDGACVGVCEPGTGACDGQQPQLCDAAGQWQPTGETCAGQACQAGSCIGECEPGAVRCAGDAVETCDANGNWVASTCPSTACTAGVCVDGACAELPANEGASCDDGNVCTQDACAGGACVGTPLPDDTACADADGCTLGTTCQAGSCTAPTQTVSECVSGDQCCPAGCSGDGDGDCLYWASGVQQNVPVAALGGWSECYRAVYGSFGPNLADLLAGCPGSKLMLGCRPIGSSELTVAAMADRADVLFDCGNQYDCVHEANGVGWYYSDEYSWGFAPAGLPVQRNSCDVDESSPEQRMCWHTGGGAMNGGWSCGAARWLNDDMMFERLVYAAP